MRWMYIEAKRERERERDEFALLSRLPPAPSLDISTFHSAFCSVLGFIHSHKPQSPPTTLSPSINPGLIVSPGSVMLAVKGALVGQAFAVARCSDSGGRKSRIRRSKEERKATAESFIKKYQKLNNGNFPSLNLTHKEVGGSFYTVREIVREIIQENRVLGPAKFSTNEPDSDEFLKQFPLGAISMEPQTHFSASSDETRFALDPQQGASEELDGQFTEPEDKWVDNGQMINGKRPGEDSAIHDKLTLQVGETLVAGENVEEMEASAAKVTNTTAGKVSSDETCFLLDHRGGTNEEMLINSSGQLTEPPEHQRFDNEQIIDGNQAGQKFFKTDELITLHVSESLEAGKNVKEMEPSAAKVGKTTASVTVEFTEPQQGLSKELLFNSNTKLNEPEHQRFDNGPTINVNQAGEKNEISDITLQASKNWEAGKDVREMEGSAAKVTNITAGVIVETFPLRLTTKQTQSLGKRTGKVAGPLEDNETKDIGMESGHGSSLMDEKVATNPVLEKKPGLVDEKPELNYGNTTQESLNTSTTKGVMYDTHGGEDLEVSPFNDDSASKALGKSHAVNETIPISAPNGVEIRTSTTSTTASSSFKNPKSGAVAAENEAEVCGSDNSQKECNPSLDRINLDSWASKKSTGQETNPILAFFKAFIAAFVEFWSE